MIGHIVMWKLNNPLDAPLFKAQLDTCLNPVPGMQTFEVAIRTPALEANCDVVLYSGFTDAAALALAPCGTPAACSITTLKEEPPHDARQSPHHPPTF